MNARTNRHGLQIARPLHELVVEQILPGTGIDAEALWRGFAAILRRPRPAQPRRCWRAATSCRPRSTPGTARTGPAARCSGLSRLPGRDRLPGARGPGLHDRHRKRRRRDRPHRRAAARGAGDNARYALNAANARWGSLYDALYGTDVDPRGRRGRRAPAPTTRCAGRAVIACARAPSWTSAAPLAARQPHATPPATRCRAASCWSRSATAQTRLRDAGAVRRLPRRARGARSPSCWCNHGLHVEIQIDRDAPDRQGRCRRASRTCCSNRPSPPSRTARTRSPRSMPRTRSSSTATGWA